MSCMPACVSSALPALLPSWLRSWSTRWKYHSGDMCNRVASGFCQFSSSKSTRVSMACACAQGPPLAANIRHYLCGEPLVSFTPQSTHLALISAGHPYAVGTKGWFTFQGAWVWSLKDWIDRAFMYKYGRDLPINDMMVGGQQCEVLHSTLVLCNIGHIGYLV